MAEKQQERPMPKFGNVLDPDLDWVAKVREPALEPDLPIVDPHHHLWDRPNNHYLLPDLLADCNEGHNVVGTVFVECGSMFRASGPEEMKAVGEVEFVNGVAAMSASGQYGKTRACDGIVGHAELRIGARVRDVLEAQMRAGGRRFSGIRFSTGWDADLRVRRARTDPAEKLMYDKTWREGFAQIGKLGLTYDCWMYHPQIKEMADLASAFPDTVMVLDHVGGPLGFGPYEDHQETFRTWKAAMAELAKRPNMNIKLGGLGMPLGLYDFFKQPSPPSSETLAKAYKPWIETCIELFGAERCMFESNFPVDKITSGFGVLWNAFKRLAANASASEKKALFSGTATRVYKLALA
ncbi:Predicted metal-dependent hydrolase, TIM-barrel fold [Enhydrobacter aerosaccus]|uniref:Predicted metal-dependent hydrolase, TIM-barrel fold n=1 Tax=Enhydrobacter aerosaccus TaxID=225324 RepID=A0A1T4TFE4_9HYPH|nr:amidohydrolase family protein [Enhydrobacter aerosaccus]SKA39176.1 Predicted metal-dependent hydrolase, TIM-barrel fold [Enhydrobacter aerosaccus]